MFPGNNDDLRVIGKDLFEISGYFAVDGASAVLATSATRPAAGLVGTWTKIAGTGLYRFTFISTATPNDVFWACGVAFGAAGTLDRVFEPVAKNLNANSFVSSVDFQSRKKSDGTAVDPVSLTFMYNIRCKGSSLNP